MTQETTLSPTEPSVTGAQATESPAERPNWLPQNFEHPEGTFKDEVQR